MVIEHPHTETYFEQLYQAVRQHEARIYTDEEVMRLPQIGHGHRHEQEWEMRRRSAKRLMDYMSRQRRPLKMLEVGCGNGWLSAELSGVSQSEVIGLDVNRAELHQAQRVFKGPNLKYINSIFDEETFKGEKFDMIIFAAVLPYFKSVNNTLSFALSLLRPEGEIHIVDTHFYDKQSAIIAANRCREYYEEMGLPAMADHYYHHQLSELNSFRHQCLVDPNSLMSRLVRKEPFYWVVVKPEEK